MKNIINKIANKTTNLFNKTHDKVKPQLDISIWIEIENQVWVSVYDQHETINRNDILRQLY